MTELEALTTIEHAIDYLVTRGYPDDGILMAIGTLYEAHKAILFKICDNYRSVGEARSTISTFKLFELFPDEPSARKYNGLETY